MGWQNIVRMTTGTVQYYKDFGKKEKGWTNNKNYPPVDDILFHLGLLSQNAAGKDPQHTQSMRVFSQGVSEILAAIFTANIEWTWTLKKL